MVWRWETFVFAIIAFGILYWLLNRYAFGPLFNVMEKRREHVRTELESAEQSRKEALTFMEGQKAALVDARKEAYDIIEQARLTGVKQADDLVLLAKQESLRIRDEALNDIGNEKNKAIAELRSQVSGMSVMIASKIIEKQIDEKSQQELIEQYLGDVGGKL